MDDERLKQFLTQRAEQEIPETMDLRDSLHQQIRSGSMSRSGLRLRRALLVVVLLLMTATVAYALYQTVIQPDPGIQAVQKDDLIVHLDQTQAVTPPEGVTPKISPISVTLDYAYADANRITVAFSAAAPDAADQALDLYANPTLTDSAGTQYLWLTSSGQQARDSDHSALSGIMSFDASTMTDTARSLELKLQIDIAYTTAEMRTSMPDAMSMAGTTSFSFTVPFNPGKTVVIDQTATSANLAIQVKQMVIAPSLTRFDVCYDPTHLSGDAWLSWQAAVSLEVAGKQVLDQQPAGIEGFREADAPCRALTLSQSLLDQVGTWTLTIHDFHNLDTGETLSGNWSYTFKVDG